MSRYTYHTQYGVDYYKLYRNGRTPIQKQAIYSTGEPNTRVKIGEKTTGGELTASGWAGAAGIGMEIGKGVGDAIGGYITAKATATALRAQAAISEDNARVAQFGVEQAFRAGELQLAQIGHKQAETKAQQRVAYAANGIAIGVGSSAEAMASTDLQAEADKITARQNALAQAWGYRRQRMMAFATAEGNRIMAKATTKAGRVNMYAGLASTALSAWAGFAGA